MHTTKDGSLKLDNPPVAISGTDASLGSFTGYSASFNNNILNVSFVLYSGYNALVFRQYFPTGMVGTSNGNEHDVSTGFPSFSEPNDANLAFVNWANCMNQAKHGVWTQQSTSQGSFGIHGGVFALYNQSGASFVMSSFNQYMTTSQLFSGIASNSFASGFNGMISGIPAGTVFETLVVAGQNINNTMMSWGDLLLMRGGKTRTKHDADLVISKLGYWTDNGATYYYMTQPNLTMEQTMVQVLEYYQQLNLPIWSVQYDSWWYWKECTGGPNNWLNCKGAVELWEPRPDVFPDEFNFDLGVPLILHNRWFSGVNNTYIRSLGFQNSFYVESAVDFALPIKKDVFLYLMSKAKNWGMVMYEQDWLSTVFDTMNVTKTNITAASTWLQAMADAASELGLTIQYCMPYPKHALESTKHQVVTNARASGDYHPGADYNYQIEDSSLFYWAIGIAPSKDDYWTSEVQPNPYTDNPTEPNWQLISIIVALSTGPNGPSDYIGLTNSSVVLATIRGDGTTVQPSRPATITDAALKAIWSLNEVPDIRSTWVAHVSHTYRWHYVLAVSLKASFTFPVTELGPNFAASTYAVYNFFNPTYPVSIVPATSGGSFLIPFGQSQPSAPVKAANISYMAVVPQLPGGFFLYGAKGKVVGASHQVIADVTLLGGNDGFTATIVGSANENGFISILVAKGDGILFPVSCPSSAGATSTLTCSASGGKCICS
jgi:hypothetical protein